MGRFGGSRAGDHPVGTGAPASGSIYLIDSDGQTLKLPMPSDSPYDPLNWSLTRRLLAFGVLIVFSIVSMIGIQAASLMYSLLAEEYKGKTNHLALSVLVSTPSTLSLGLGAFLWIPLSVAIGRRPVFLLAACSMTVATVLAAYTTGFCQLLGALTLQGISAGMNLSLSLLIVIDLTFIDERPNALGMFWSVGAATGLIAMPIVPALASFKGWRGFYFIWIGPCALVIIYAFFCLPETYFVRPAVAFNGRVLVQEGSERVHMYDDWADTPVIKPPNHNAAVGSNKSHNHSHNHKHNRNHNRNQRNHNNNPAAAAEAGIQPPSNTTSSSISCFSSSSSSSSCAAGTSAETRWQWMVRHWGFGKRGAGFREMRICYVQTLLCACNPLVFWLAVLTAFNFSAMIFIGTTFPVIMAQPPYNLPNRIISMVNPFAAIGAVISWPVSTILTTKVARRLTLRNGGIRDAEHYLIAFLPPVIASASGLFLYGLTVRYHLSVVFIFISYVLNAFSVGAYGIASTIWVTEAFPRWAAPAMIIVGGAGYLLSYGTSSAVTPWLQSQGYFGVSCELGAIILAIGGIALPLAFWGKGLRQYIDGRWGMSEAGALRPQ